MQIWSEDDFNYLCTYDLYSPVHNVLDACPRGRFQGPTSFPSPAGMSLAKLPLGRNNSVMTSLFPPRESLVVTSRLGTGNSRSFFYGVLIGVEEQEYKGTCSPCSGSSPPLQNLSEINYASPVHKSISLTLFPFYLFRGSNGSFPPEHLGWNWLCQLLSTFLLVSLPYFSSLFKSILFSIEEFYVKVQCLEIFSCRFA